MLKSELISEHRKLAYLEALGLTPLVATRIPLVHQPPVRVSVRTQASPQPSGSAPENPGPSASITDIQQLKNGILKSDSFDSGSDAKASLLDRPRAVIKEAKAQAQSHEHLETETSPLGSESKTKRSDRQDTVTESAVSVDMQSPQSGQSAFKNTPLKADAESNVLTSAADERELPDKFSVLLCHNSQFAAISLEFEPRPQHWNLLRNICVACNPPDLESVRGEVKLVEFHWPIPGLDKVSDPLDAAQHALAGFLTKQCQSDIERVLVLGQEAKTAGSLFFSGWDASQILFGSSLTDLLNSADLKRTLWEEIKHKGFA